ncbi:MAG: hypothetical protein IPL59_08230 [Candidatus Competibacteraceae bacterium]|nr:hypothetical protein [Candidatus Competibacteraceae bacterium]
MVGSGTINGQTHAFLMSPIGQDLGSAIGVFPNSQWFLDANSNGARGMVAAPSFASPALGRPATCPPPGTGTAAARAPLVYCVRAPADGSLIATATGNGWLRRRRAATVVSAKRAICPVAGDWNGTSFAKIGVFRNGQWFLDNGNGKWDGCGTEICLSFGQLGDLPVAGNWNGGLKAGVGVFRAGTWFLDYSGNGQWDGCDVDRCYFGSFSQAGDFLVAGDWNGDSKAKVGVFRAGTWYLDYNGNGAWDGCGIDRCYFGSFGKQGDLPVAGRW